jgi:hypothetical protein
MKGTLWVLVVIVTVIALSSVVRAEDHTEKGTDDAVRHPPGKHRHQSPHGGQMVSTGSYHFELVAHEGEIHLYAFSQGMTPLPVKDLTGSIEILVPGQETRRVELQPGSDALDAKLDLIGVRKLIAVVTLIIDGKAQAARFSIDFRAHHRDETGRLSGPERHAHHRTSGSVGAGG